MGVSGLCMSPALYLTPAHGRSQDEEFAYVREGLIVGVVDGELCAWKSGACMSALRGSRHGFRNTAAPFSNGKAAGGGNVRAVWALAPSDAGLNGDARSDVGGFHQLQRF